MNTICIAALFSTEFGRVREMIIVVISEREYNASIGTDLTAPSSSSHRGSKGLLRGPRRARIVR